jgi:hypothetical protein
MSRGKKGGREGKRREEKRKESRKEEERERGLVAPWFVLLECGTVVASQTSIYEGDRNEKGTEEGDIDEWPDGIALFSLSLFIISFHLFSFSLFSLDEKMGEDR